MPPLFDSRGRRHADVFACALAIAACGARTSADDLDLEPTAGDDASLPGDGDDASDSVDASFADAAEASTYDGPVFGGDAAFDSSSGHKDSGGGPPDAAIGDAAAAPCDSTCSGCCEAGVCIQLTAQTRDACGFGGRQCASCGADGTCIKGGCFRPQPNCSAANCNGCCEGTDSCGTGVAGDACGFGGHQCAGWA